MIELIQRLADTPLPQIFIFAGIFFLILSVVNKFGGKLDINPKRQGQAILIGAVLIIVGLFIFLQPPQPVIDDNPDEDNIPVNEQDIIHPEPESKFLISIYSIENKEVIIRDEICRFHISKGYACEEGADHHLQNTRFSIRVDNRELAATDRVKNMQDHNGCHVEQHFEFRLNEPGRRYKVEAQTKEVNGDPVDSKTFFIVRE